MARWNRQVVSEINNGGGILLLGSFNSAGFTNDPSTVADFGNAFFVNDGYALDRGGVKVPQVGVPIATLTGWSLRRAPYVDGDLEDAENSTVLEGVKGPPGDDDHAGDAD